MSTKLLGREAELQQLDARLREARAGSGQLFLIAGEPGLGKTHLAATAAVNAAAAGVQVLWGRCREEGGTPAHWPWVQVLRAMARTIDPAILAEAAGRGVPLLCAAVPELGERLGTPVSGVSAATRFAFFDAVETFLRQLSERLPLMLIIDDLHAADVASLALLEFLAPEVSRSRLLLLATYREHEASLNHAGPIVARAVRFGERIRLGGLGGTDVARLVSETAGHDVSPRVVDAVLRATEGNPLFVQEMVRSFASKEKLDAAEGLRYIELADSVQHVIATRLEPLSNAAREVLGAAAVIGRNFDVATLEGATDIPPYEILTHVQAAIDAGIVSLGGGVRGEAAFVHALYREFFYTGLPAAERASLHARVAAALEQQNEERNLAQIAFHLLEAGPVAGAARAAKYSLRAGDQAAAQLAYAQAVKHYEDALLALDAAGDQDDRCEVLLRLGDANLRAGSGEASKAAFRAAADAARATGDVRRLARAAIGLAGPWSTTGGLPREEVIRALENALTVVDDGDPPMRSILLARLAVELYLTDRLGESILKSQEAFDLSRLCGDRHAMCEALLAKHLVVGRDAPLDERCKQAREAVRLGTELGDDELAFQGRFQLINVLMESGDRAAIDREVNAAARAAERLRQPFYLWFVAAWRATLALVDGRLEAAESLIDKAFAGGSRVQSQEEAAQFAVPVYQIQLFCLRLERGAGLEEIEAPWRAMMESVPIPIMRFSLARLHTAMGHLAEARDELEHLAADDFAALPQDWTGIPCLGFAAETCSDLGDTERAPTLYELLLPYATHHFSNGSYYLGSMHHCLGRLAATMGRDADAAAHFEAALEAHRRMGARCRLTHTQVHYAEVLLRSHEPHDRHRGRTLLHRALERARQIGMRGAAIAAEGLLAECDGEGPTQAARVRSGDAAGVDRAVFRKAGDSWTVEFAGIACQLKHARGLQYLQQLLRSPGREFHATDLVQAVLGTPSEVVAISPGTRISPTLGDAGPELDAQAATEYRGRLVALREDLAEAERFTDLGRAADARREIDFLSTELAAAARGGRTASHAERARLTVTKGIKAALEKLHRHHPLLARHLEATVRRGYFCSYTPDPRHPISWQVE